MNKLIVSLYAVAAVIASISAITVDQKSQIQAAFLEAGVKCLKEHHLTADDVKALKAKTLPEGDNASCFISCLFKSVGLMDDSGKLSQTKAIEQGKDILSEEDLKNVQELISTCEKVNDQEVNDKGCERAGLIFTCLNENISKLGFDIEV